MADFIDALVVALKLDPTEYNEEILKFREDRKRLAEEDRKYNEKSEDGQKKQSEGLRKLRNQTVGFVAAVAGASSITSFFQQMVTGAASTGRMAANLGMATERVGAWEQAVRRAGGTAQSAQGSLNLMAGLYQSMKSGTLGADQQGLLMQLGVGELKENPEENLMAISGSADRLGRQRFAYMASQLGLDPGTINVLAKGPEEVRRVVDEMQRLHEVTQDDVDAAIALEESLVELSETIRGSLQPAISATAEGLSIMARGLKGLTSSWIWKKLTGEDTSAPSGGGGGGPASTSGPMTLPGGQTIGAGMAGYAAAQSLFTVGPAPRMSVPQGPISTPGMARGGASVGNSSRNAQAVENYFRSKGYTPAQARGIAAAVVAEGGLSQRTGGGYERRALGIGQLLGPRRAKFLKKYGPNFTLQNELDFMHWELQGGDRGGAKVLRQTTAEGTLRSMVDDFYRPAKGEQTSGDMRRGREYLSRAGGNVRTQSTRSVTTNNTTNIGVVEIKTDGRSVEAISADIQKELKKRNLTNHANTGLQS